MKTFAPHLALIRDALHYVREYQPADVHAFRINTMAQDAILMRLQVIGENLAAMKRIDEDQYYSLADPSWDNIIGLRNIISHGYHHIDAEQIWQIVEEELDGFSRSIESVADAP